MSVNKTFFEIWSNFTDQFVHSWCLSFELKKINTCRPADAVANAATIASDFLLADLPEYVCIFDRDKKVKCEIKYKTQFIIR